MKSLSDAALDQTVQSFRHTARPLERALYTYHFQDGSAADVLDALSAFQNDDGGFGHALEADIRLADSSVIATSIAFQRLHELDAPADHPLVVKGCAYLLKTFDAETLNWPIIPVNIDDAPHAPWWVHGGDLEHSLSNPRAEIAGCLNAYPQHFPEALREQVTQAVVDHLMNHPDEMEMHDLQCYLRFYESPGLPEATTSMMLGKLKRLVDHVVSRDPAQWRSYGLPPLGVVASPESPFAEMYANEIPQNLDFLIDSRGADGVWEPAWVWGEPGDPAWAQAKKDWTGVITLENLKKLRAFGRIG